jgi:hypothetical protein
MSTNIKSAEYIIAINPNNLSTIFNLSNMNRLAELHDGLKITNNLHLI